MSKCTKGEYQYKAFKNHLCPFWSSFNTDKQRKIKTKGEIETKIKTKPLVPFHMCKIKPI